MTGAIWGACGVLFASGLILMVFRRQLLAMLLGLELMINAANIALVYYSSLFADAETMSVALLIIAVAAAEAGIGLSLIIQLQRSARPTDSASLRELFG